MYRDLREYICRLEQEEELIRIKKFVDSDLEIAEITDRFCKCEGGGKALFFENTRTDFPVLTNMMGSDKRICMALGVGRLEELNERISDMFGKATAPKTVLSDKLKMIPLLGQVANWMPKRKRGKGECQQVVLCGEEVDLGRLPVLKCAPFDGGRFITLPLVHTVDPVTGVGNVGMYRMQLFSKNTTGMHWHRHKTGERHYSEYKRLGKKMPVTVCLGGDPVYTYSATAPLPDNVDEYMLAGFIRKKPVELVKCITNDLYVPADCDFVIEGYVDPSEEKVVEGAFGDHTGFYSLEDFYPLFHVTCITYRKDAVYPATLVGVPPMEDLYIAKATERIFLAPIRLMMQPDITDMFMPWEGVAHNIVLLDIEKKYPGQGFKVASSMWGAGQMMFNKFMLVTSGLAGQLGDKEKIKERLRNISVPDDLLFSKGPLDVLDHTAPAMGFGGKLCIDATEKFSEESFGRYEKDISVPETFALPFGVAEADTKLLKEGWPVLFVYAGRDVDFRQVSQEVMENNGLEGLKFMVLFDEQVAECNYRLLLWLIGNNADAVRDTFIYRNTLVIDARAKFGGLNGFSRRWPNIVAMDKKTIAEVDAKWNEWELGAFISSPSLEYERLLFPGTTDVK